MLKTTAFGYQGVIYNCKHLDYERMNNLYTLTDFLEYLRNRLSGYTGCDVPVYVNSGLRSPKVNSSVGGVSNSDHLSGLGVDIDISRYGSDVIDFLHYLLKDEFGRSVRYYKFYHGYVHISIFKNLSLCI